MKAGELPELVTFLERGVVMRTQFDFSALARVAMRLVADQTVELTGSPRKQARPKVV